MNNENNIKPLPTPYYGKDRTCARCDTCPEGYEILAGCKGLNNPYNTICQRK